VSIEDDGRIAGDRELRRKDRIDAFLGDYIAVESTNTKAQALWTGNGAHGMDVFSARAVFAP